MRLPLIAARGFESHPLRHMKIEVLYNVQGFFFLPNRGRGQSFILCGSMKRQVFAISWRTR